MTKKELINLLSEYYRPEKININKVIHKKRRTDSFASMHTTIITPIPRGFIPFLF
jgi:hypothetical protein